MKHYTPDFLIRLYDAGVPRASLHKHLTSPRNLPHRIQHRRQADPPLPLDVLIRIAADQIDDPTLIALLLKTDKFTVLEVLK